MTHVPQDVLDRIRQMENKIRTLEGRSQMRPALNEILNGDVVIGEGGQLVVRPPGSNLSMFAVGRWADGSYGLRVRRDDETTALTIGGETQVDVKEMVRFFSRSGAIIVMDDAFADGFLGRPSMPIPMQPTSGRETSNTAATTAWTGCSRLMNPVLYSAWEVYVPSGVTADCQFTADGQTIAEWTVSVSGGGWQLKEITAPVKGNFMDHVSYRMTQNVRSGTGTIRSNCLGVYTRNTFTQAEAPSA